MDLLNALDPSPLCKYEKERMARIEANRKRMGAFASAGEGGGGRRLGGAVGRSHGSGGWWIAMERAPVDHSPCKPAA